MPVTCDRSKHWLRLSFIALAFILWGYLRSLNDLLIPVFQVDLRLSYSSAMLVHFAFFSSYLFISLPAARWVERRGYRAVLVQANLAMAVGSASFLLLAWRPSFAACLMAVLIEAIGITLLQVAANPWITLLAPSDSAASRLLFLQMFTSLGSVSGPILGHLMLPVGAASLVSTPEFPRHQVVLLYMPAAISLFATAAGFRWTATPNTSVYPSLPRRAGIIFRERAVLYGFAAIFLAIGAETAILGHAIRLLSSKADASFHPRTAAILLSGYWAAVMLGRLVGARVLTYLKTSLTLLISSISACLITLLAVAIPGKVTGVVLLFSGLFNAVMFPCVFVLTISNLPETEAPTVSGLLTSALCGGAVIPVLSGAVADHFGVTSALILPACCYLLIACYAVRLPQTQ